MFIKLYSIAFLVFIAIDMIWLGLVAKTFYATHIGFLMKQDVNWLAAIIFYLLFIAGIIVFVVNPALEKQNWVPALMHGALFGLVTYATYDLTNLATIRNWPLIVTVVDLIWGTVLSATVSVISFFIARKIGV